METENITNFYMADILCYGVSGFITRVLQGRLHLLLPATGEIVRSRQLAPEQQRDTHMRQANVGDSVLVKQYNANFK